MAAEMLAQLVELARHNDLEENLELAQEYISQRGSITANEAESEGNVKKGLKRCMKSVHSILSRSRRELQDIEPQIRKLSAEEQALKSERTCAFKNMVQAQMNRVGAPRIDVCAREIPEGLAMEAVTLDAPAEAFNNLYHDLRSRHGAAPEWNCTDVAALRPEKDLLGMCPGGKPHLSEEQLKKMKGKCMCSICIPERRLADVRQRLAPLRPKATNLRETIRDQTSVLGSCRRLVPRFRGGVGRERDEDPVFYSDEMTDDDAAFNNDEDALIVHQHARAEWERLQNTLQVTDFPLRVVFLDKSASMGCDTISYEALQLGLHNSLNPTRGSTLTFLFAGPGETQMALRRPGDAPLTFAFQLGSATWFNEPILKTLRFLAPLVEQLDTQAWIQEYGEPPLQVLCLTDGQDNQSPEEVSTLSGLVRELKEIVGPVSGEKLYVPIPGPLKKHTALLDEGNTKVPVWLAWVACGMGGSALLQGKAPKEICIVDAVAVPQLREPDNFALDDEEPSQECQEQDDDDHENKTLHCASSTVVSRARQRVSASVGNASLCAGVEATQVEWRVGHRVRIRASGLGRAPKAAVVLKVLANEGNGSQYELLFDDETTATVDASQLLGMPEAQTTMLRLQQGKGKPKGMKAESGILARTCEPDMQRLQVLRVVNEVTQDLASVMQTRSSKSSKVSLEAAMKLISGEEGVSDESACALEAAISHAKSSSNVTTVQQVPLVEPSDLLQEVLLELGRAAASLIPEDRMLAQRFVSIGLEMLASGGSVMPAHISDQLGPFVGMLEANSQRRLPSKGDEELEAWRKVVSRPLETLLNFLYNRGLLESQCNVDGQMYLAVQEALPCLVTLWRYVDPSSNRSGFEDALRRAVNRFQRTRRSFSFGSATSSSDVTTSRTSISRAASLGRSPSIPGLGVAVELPQISNTTASPPSARGLSKEMSRASSKTMRSSRGVSRCSTPSSASSSRGSSDGRLGDAACIGSSSNCSTARSASSVTLRHSQSQAAAKSSIFVAAGSRLFPAITR